jgi:hypothetical protein
MRRAFLTGAALRDGTAVTIVHSGWERLGGRGAQLRERNQRGWGGLVPRFEAFVRDRTAALRKRV